MTQGELDEEEGEPWLFSDTSVCALCLLWLIVWPLLLWLLPSGVSGKSGSLSVKSGSPKTNNPGGQDEGTDEVATQTSSSGDESACPARTEQLDLYLRKLQRMRVFCIVASTAGVLLFASCFFAEEPLLEMLMQFGPAQQVLFTMAIAHWVVNIWEDWKTRAFLGQGLRKESGGSVALWPFNLCCGPKEVMLGVYFVHHAISAFVYGLSLATRQLGGVMVQGLLFELPVLLMLRKEIAAAREPPAAWLHSLPQVRRHWMLQYLAFALGRGPATVLWLVSVIPGRGRDLFASIGLGLGMTIAYHLMAIFFTSLNLRILGLYMVWQSQDMKRARERGQPRTTSSSSYCSSTRTTPTKEQEFHAVILS